MHVIPITKIYNNQNDFIFAKNNVDILLRDLNDELNIILTKDNIKYLYHNFTTTLSISIIKFSIMVSLKMRIN